MSLLLYILLGFLAIILFLLAYFTYKGKQTKAYFQKQGLPYLETSMLGVMFGSKPLVEWEHDLYKQARSFENLPMVGTADTGGKLLHYITDLDLVRSITVMDFDHFYERRSIQTEQTNKYFKRMLFFTNGEQWKATRSKLSSSFTASKMRRMFQIFKQSSQRMDVYLKDQIMEYPKSKSVDVDFMKLLSKYTMDVIASSAFGVDSKCFEVTPEQKSTFERMGDQFGLKFTGKAAMKFVLMLTAPKVADFFGIDIMDAESQNYFVNVIKSVLKHRRQTGEKREDFLQLMMELQAGTLKADEESNEIMNGTAEFDDKGKHVGISSSFGVDAGESSKDKVVFDDDNIIANGLEFFLAGFDNTQSALLFVLYNIAIEEKVQQKLYEEVKSVMKENGELSYEAVNDMKYLGMVLNESLRMYPPAGRTERLCTKDFPVPGTNFVIKKGTIAALPIRGIHMDPRHFPNPEKFIPERFSPENKSARHPYAFMVFGQGPRNCIGNRFVMVKVKAVIAQLVYSFHFAPCSKTKIPMEFDRSPSVKPKDDMWLNVTVRE